jgi:hypothetical protein
LARTNSGFLAVLRAFAAEETAISGECSPKMNPGGLFARQSAVGPPQAGSMWRLDVAAPNAYVRGLL